MRKDPLIEEAKNQILTNMRANKIHVGDAYNIPLDMIADVHMDDGEETYSDDSISVAYYKGETVFRLRDGNHRYHIAKRNNEKLIWGTVIGVYKR